MSGRRGFYNRRGGEEGEGRANTVSDKTFTDHMTVLRTSDKITKDSRLKPTKVDFHETENRKEHHTDEYEIKNLIVRRGQVFSLSVTFDRPMDKAQDDKIILQFVTGSRPRQSKNSIMRVQDTKNLSTSSWGMQIVKQSGATVDLTVMSPADAIVGEYSVYVETKSKNSDGKYLSFRQLQDQKIYILFNAWCKDDSVFMEDEDHRKEYVLNDHGRIWRGSLKYGIIPWNFGQFEAVSLETCLKLIEMGEVKGRARGYPLFICRAISKMVNSDDDDGVLVGCWSWPYPAGTTPPSAWTGSVAILEQFYKRQKPVKYGQCWVFSGLVTTLLRAIGIPTRSVTNVASGRDTDQSMTIDYHFDEEGKPIDELNDDFVWNFHVWNESYFTRPDLPSGNDGWQAHDATPQETSDGVYQCGPCPISAIKKGEVYMPYDSGFMFSEVNGDEVHWEVDKDGEMRVTDIKEKSIGKFISTKAVGSNERENLTKNYKFPEGSQKNRDAVKLAYKYSSRKDKDIYKMSSSNDVVFEVLTSEDVMIGGSFDIKLSLKNTSGDARTVQVTIVAKTSFYTGVVATDLKEMKTEVTLAEGQEKMVVLPITVDDYVVKMAPDASIKVYFQAKVKETGQVFGDLDAVEFTKPELEATFPKTVSLHVPFQMVFIFTNPLPVKLEHCKLNIESSGMIPHTLTKTMKDIEPYGKASSLIGMKYGRRGRRYVEAVFHSDQLSGVRGEFEIEVSP